MEQSFRQVSAKCSYTSIFQAPTRGHRNVKCGFSGGFQALGVGFSETPRPNFTVSGLFCATEIVVELWPFPKCPNDSIGR